MSHSFYISNVANLQVDPIFDSIGLSNLYFLEQEGSPRGQAWPQGYAHIYEDQVTARAIETSYEGNELQVRLMAFSSPADYKLALKLVEAVAQHCGSAITPEDNKTLSLEEFKQHYGLDWIKSHCLQSLSMLLGRHQKEPEGTSKISGVRGELAFGKRVLTQLMQNPKQAANKFFERLQTLNYLDGKDIFQATLTVLERKDDGRRVVVATWSEGVPTVIKDKNTVVTLYTFSESDAPPDDGGMHVHIQDLAHILGEQAMWLSEDLLLLPQLEGEQWKEVCKKAEQYRCADIFDYSYLPENDTEANNEDVSDKITTADLDALANLPIVIFVAVAGADGDIDKKEIEAFYKQLAAGMLADQVILRAAALMTVANFQERMTQALTGQLDAHSTIMRARDLLHTKLARDEALEIKRALMQIGKKIAEASGGFLGFGSKISKQEQRALDAIRQILELED